MSLCPQCENNAFIISDTNLIVFLMNYVSNFNHSIQINDYCSQLGQFLGLIANCSQNNLINITQRLYDVELDFFNNRRCTLDRKAHYFHRCRNNEKRQILSEVNSHLNILTVQNNDVNRLKTKSNIHIQPHPPREIDVSLLILGMEKSNLNNNTSIIITEDEKLRRLLDEVLYPETQFTRDDGTVWEVDNVLTQNVIDPLSRIYSCCKFDDIDKMYNYYADYFLLKRLDELGNRTQIIKTRIMIDSSAHKERCKYQKAQNRLGGICA